MTSLPSSLVIRASLNGAPLVASVSLSREEYGFLLLRELEATGPVFASSGDLDRAYALRDVQDFRCRHCGVYVAPSITGMYDDGTCADCGAIEEEHGEDDDARLAAILERMAATVRCYSRTFDWDGFEGKTRNAKRGRREVDGMIWMQDRATFPAHSVEGARLFLNPKVA